VAHGATGHELGAMGVSDVGELAHDGLGDRPDRLAYLAEEVVDRHLGSLGLGRPERVFDVVVDQKGRLVLVGGTFAFFRSGLRGRGALFSLPVGVGGGRDPRLDDDPLLERWSALDPIAGKQITRRRKWLHCFFEQTH